MNLDELRHAEFSEIEPGAPQGKPSWKIAVLKSGAVRITLPQSIAPKLIDKPVHVAAAAHEGRGYIRLMGGGPGKTHQFSRRGSKNGRLGYFALTLHQHPFEPGVVHRAVPVTAQTRADGGIIIECPDWDEILGDALAGEAAEGEA